MIASSGPLTGRAVFLWLIGFFGLVIAVNGAFIYFAERSFPGVSAQNAYETGLEYNQVLTAAEKQRALGWTVELSVDKTTMSLLLKIRDANNRPVASPMITAELHRPAEAADDRRIDFRNVGEGLYRADHALTAHGNWDAAVHIVRANAPDYVLEQRLWVP